MGDFDIASNPEFLKEGAAIKDFMSPDRVVVGVESERARKLMSKLYRPFLLNNFRVIFMDVPSAEMTKYAANAGDFHGCPIGGDDQICGERDVGNTNQLHERDREPVRDSRG